jgi:hypothetical protein
MAATNAPITYLDNVQVWDIGLEQLAAYGWTAAAAVQWGCRGLTRVQEAVLTDVWDFAAQLSHKRQDWLLRPDQMHALLAGRDGRRTGFELLSHQQSSVHWSIEFSVSAGLRAVGDGRLLPCTLRLGVFCTQPFIEYLITDNVGGKPLTLHVQPSPEGGHPLSYTWSLKASRGRKQERQRLQEFDAAELEPIALIDNAWKPRPLAESVMAQLIDWHFRITDRHTSVSLNCPSPAPDALQWWIAWATKVSGNPDVGYQEALTVAQRSVRPPTPAGHHRYWRESLRPRSRTRIDQACSMLGISRSTAYNRLQRSGKRAREFTSVNDLNDFLRSQEPRRRLAADQHSIIEALVASGLTQEAARKREYRTRHLPDQQRRERLLKAVKKSEQRDA